MVTITSGDGQKLNKRQLPDEMDIITLTIDGIPIEAQRGEQVLWETQEVETICPCCGVGCGIYLGIDKGAIASVRGNDQNTVNNGRG